MTENTKNQKKETYLYAFEYNEDNKERSQIDIRIYEGGEWEDKTNYTDWTNEEIELYNNSKYGKLMGHIEIEGLIEGRDEWCMGCGEWREEIRGKLKTYKTEEGEETLCKGCAEDDER
tara:strand:+ start:117 stop:470 length:354 start_codon:yes stop_codon:yes gene_type:complete